MVQNLSISEIKLIRSLRQSKVRKREGMFVAEGHKLIEILSQSLFCKYLVLRNDCGDNFFGIDQKKIRVCDKKQYEDISSLVNGTGQLAVLGGVYPVLNELTASGHILLLDHIQDPGNMGSILRTASWFGWKTIMALNCVDIYNPKVVQSAMGAHAIVKVYACNNEEFNTWHQTQKVQILTTDVSGKSVEQYLQQKNTLPVILALGNEGKGISTVIKQLSNGHIWIPGGGQMESLNVSVAAAILMAKFYKNL